MASGGKSAGGQKTTQNSTSGTQIDPQTQARIQQIWNAAQGAGAAGPSPLLGGASDYYTQLMQGGQTGANALAGDPRAVQSLMDPYMKNVIDATNASYDKAGQQATQSVNDAATQAGAFGGSRQGVAQGVAQANNTLNRNNTISGLLYGGFNDAMGRAGQLAGMGYNAAGQNANLGFGGVGSPQQWLLQMLNQAYKGPMGTSTQSGGAQTTVGTQGGFKFGL